MMARLFDGPTFYTPINQESNLPNWRQGITDRIQALGTGIWKARDGNVIARIPSRQQPKDDTLRKQVQVVEEALARLRAKFDELSRSGVIRHCQCCDPDCPVFFMPPEAANELERLRAESLGPFRAAYSAFEEPRGW